MNDNEKYLFDLRGYLVVKNVLSKSQLEDLTARLEEQRKTNPHPILGHSICGWSGCQQRPPPIFAQHKPLLKKSEVKSEVNFRGQFCVQFFSLEIVGNLY